VHCGKSPLYKETLRRGTVVISLHDECDEFENGLDD
jgi:hypothetical protein